MSSQIAPNAIDTAFPKKYSDNDSQAFRDNFEIIKSNFQIARDEITQLQLTPPLTIDNISDLRLMPLDGVSPGTSINVLGYNEPGDGGGGLFFWADPSAEVDNNATVVGSVDSLSGQWIRIHRDCVNIKWFGAKGDGTTDDSVATQSALSYAIANQVALYVPAGTYILGPAVHSITATLTAATPSLSMFGDGSEVSIFKESDDRVTTSGYSDCKMLYVTTTEHAKSVTVSGIKFNKNGSSTTPLAPGSSENVDSHAISISIKTSGFLDSLTLADLKFSDKLGAHINFTSGQIDIAYLTNCIFSDFSYTGAEVGDIECKATIRQLIIDSCNGNLLRINPTDVAALNNNRASILIVNSHFDDADIAGFSEQATDMTVTVDTCELVTMSASTLKLLANNSQIGIISRPWEQLVNGSLISNSEITITSDGLNRTVPWDFNPDTIDFDCKLTVSNCSIVGDATFDNAVSGFAIESTGWYSGVTNFEITFNDCEFDPRFSKIVNANSKGNFRFNRCKLAGQDTFAQVGSSIQGTDHAYGTVEVTSCDLSQVGTTLFEFNLDIDSSAYVKIKGDHPYDKWAFSNVGDMFASARIPGSVIFEGKWLSSAAPTGPGIETQVVEISSAVYGDPCQYIALTTSDTSAVWEIKDRAVAGITQSELDLAITSLGLLTEGRLIAVETFITSGTWTKPAETGYAIAVIQAAGGGGRSVTATSAGGGGGAGQYLVVKLAGAFLGATETVTVGSGGSAGTSGGVGGNSSVTVSGVPVIAVGGSGATSSTGAAGGTSSPVVSGASVLMNIPGASGDSAAPYIAPARGGNSMLGVGGKSSITGAYVGSDVNIAAQPATGYGAGGGGSMATTASGGGSPSATATAGAPGIVVIYSYS